MQTDKMTDVTPGQPARSLRPVVLVGAVTLILVAFFSAYAYAASRPSDPTAACDVPVGDVVSTEGCAAGCCGTGAAAPVTSGEAVLEGDVQRVYVDVSKGYFDPGEIVLQAGIPAEITFSEGQGCLAEVMFEQFGILEDLTSGGAVVELPALEPGTYEFSCGMRMVFGNLVVR